jgi:ribosomal protein S18 acetylase RimI-like enzyme
VADPYVEVAMRRGLVRLPERSLPDGVSLRWYRDGDESTWLEVQRATGIYGSIGPTLFVREFGAAPEHLAERQAFAVDSDGRAVGTATAWFDPGGDPGLGRLHWVAVVPAWQRRGLGAALTCLACRRMVDLGHRSVYLTTGSTNGPAIRLYEGSGFAPWPRSEEEKAFWDGRGP